MNKKKTGQTMEGKKEKDLPSSHRERSSFAKLLLDNLPIHYFARKGWSRHTKKAARCTIAPVMRRIQEILHFCTF